MEFIQMTKFNVQLQIEVKYELNKVQIWYLKSFQQEYKNGIQKWTHMKFLRLLTVLISATVKLAGDMRT